MISLILIGTYEGILVMSSQNSQSEMGSTSHHADDILKAVRIYQSHHSGSGPQLLGKLYESDTAEVLCTASIDFTTSEKLALQGWCGPYLNESFEGYREELYDGWGSNFSWNSNLSALTSCGPDRTCGNSDDLEFKL